MFDSFFGWFCIGLFKNTYCTQCTVICGSTKGKEVISELSSNSPIPEPILTWPWGLGCLSIAGGGDQLWLLWMFSLCVLLQSSPSSRWATATTAATGSGCCFKWSACLCCCRTHPLADEQQQQQQQQDQVAAVNGQSVCAVAELTLEQMSNSSNSSRIRLLL